MITESQPTPPNEPGSPTPVAASSGRRWLLLGVAALGLLFLITAIWLSTSHGPAQSLILLSPAEAARPIPPRPFAQLRYKIRQLIYPVWRHFQRRVPFAIVSTTILTMPPLTADQTGLGTPWVTNAAGLRAWIMSTAALDAAAARFKEMPGYKVIFSPSDFAANGVPRNTRFGFSSNGTLYLNVTPRITSDSLSLVISATEVTHDPASHLSATINRRGVRGDPAFQRRGHSLRRSPPRMSVATCTAAFRRQPWTLRENRSHHRRGTESVERSRRSSAWRRTDSTAVGLSGSKLRQEWGLCSNDPVKDIFSLSPRGTSGERAGGEGFLYFFLQRQPSPFPAWA